jgi:hypothetical protein
MMTGKPQPPMESQFVSLLSTQSLIAFIAGGTAGAGEKCFLRADYLAFSVAQSIFFKFSSASAAVPS